MKKSGPPLYTWITVIVLFVLWQGAMFIFSDELFPVIGNQNKMNARWTQRALAQNEVNKIIYRENQATHPDAYHIVVIGSSLTRQNIECEDDFLLACQEKYDTSLVITKFFSAARPLKAMSELGDMFEVLHQHRPELILIEQDIISFDFNASRFFNISKNRKVKIPPLNANPIDQLRGWERAISRIGSQNRLNVAAHLQTNYFRSTPPYTTEPCVNWPNKTDISDTLTLPDRVLYPYTFERTAYCHDDLKQLQALGTEIRIVHYPRPFPLEMKYAQDSAQVEIRNTLQQFQDSLGISYWPCPLELPFAYYRDWGHMGHKGRKVFSNWLMDKIYEELILP